MPSKKPVQPSAILSDPTAYGQTFMPPWSVKCPHCGVEMVSYKNEPTDKCKKCRRKVRPSDFKVKKDLPKTAILDGTHVVTVPEKK